MKKAVNIRLEEEMLEQLDEYAHELNKTRTSLVEKAIELYFDRLDEMVADRRIDDLKKGKSEVVSIEEVFKKAGIEF
ncbi:ribbon-helix-helix protein, CopG family [Nitratifractor salsuginis]|uniref:CopG domain protein DNA-binding domain protein n=1 Tax=Nitratifractor salsuginis (strain DSM 16511 / JCM 12458 / E9I37-1) TaxID=749222 RepID=E6X381_NITSE|nr:ribbon-helix-helix protein, CopG family [Nitratifractor salsuginis]ADV47294.1 CopG domain protein DNA-binding domain protein [Nitratifractor salsuginis DSM 16511]